MRGIESHCQTKTKKVYSQHRQPTEKIPMRKGNDLPKSYLSEAEKQEILSKLGQNMLYTEESKAALNAGDEDASWRWLSLAVLPKYSIAFLEKAKGEFVNKYRFGGNVVS